MCLVIDKITKIRKPRTGFILREKASDGVLTPVYNDNVLCRGKIGDTITDPNWNTDYVHSFKVGQRIGIGCLHVFKNKRDAILARNDNCYEDIIIVEVLITPDLLLIGHTSGFDHDLDPLPCYGCKSYRLEKIV